MRVKEGKKHDEGKLRYDLFPQEALDGIAEALTHGAKKYGDRNWELGLKWGRIFGALMRHLWAWWGGEEIDKDSGIHHLHLAGAEVVFLIAFVQRKAGIDTRWRAKQKKGKKK